MHFLIFIASLWFVGGPPNETGGADPAVPGNESTVGEIRDPEQPEDKTSPPDQSTDIVQPDADERDAKAASRTRDDQEVKTKTKDADSDEHWYDPFTADGVAQIVISVIEVIALYYAYSAARSAAVAADAAAAIASASLSLSRDATKRQLRAYLGARIAIIDIYEIGDPHGGRMYVRYSFKIKNYGQTPAYCVGTAAPRSDHMPSWDRPIPTIGAAPAVSKLSIAPGQQLKTELIIKVPPDAATHYRSNGSMFAIIWSSDISYKDTFGDEHVEKVRRIAGGTWPFTIGEVELHPMGNASDMPSPEPSE